MTKYNDNHLTKYAIYKRQTLENTIINKKKQITRRKKELKPYNAAYQSKNIEDTERLYLYGLTVKNIMAYKEFKRMNKIGLTLLIILLPFLITKNYMVLTSIGTSLILTGITITNGIWFLKEKKKPHTTYIAAQKQDDQINNYHEVLLNDLTHEYTKLAKETAKIEQLENEKKQLERILLQ